MYAKTNPDNPTAPKIHNLVILAGKCGIALDKEKKLHLDMITTFNMDARYQVEKYNFYQLCTREFAEKQIKIIKENAEWIKKLLAE